MRKINIIILILIPIYTYSDDVFCLPMDLTGTEIVLGEELNEGEKNALKLDDSGSCLHGYIDNKYELNELTLWMEKDGISKVQISGSYLIRDIINNDVFLKLLYMLEQNYGSPVKVETSPSWLQDLFVVEEIGLRAKDLTVAKWNIKNKYLVELTYVEKAKLEGYVRDEVTRIPVSIIFQSIQ